MQGTPGCCTQAVKHSVVSADLFEVDLNGTVWKAKRGAGSSTTLEAVGADMQSVALSAAFGCGVLWDDVLHLGEVLEPFLVLGFFPSPQEDQRARGALATACAVRSPKGTAWSWCCGFGVRCRVSLQGHAASRAHSAGLQVGSRHPTALTQPPSPQL